MIVVDATALQSEQRQRGVGLYLRALLDALEARGDVAPHYLVSRFGLAHVAHLPTARRTVLWRPHVPAHSYWLYNEVTLRAAARRLRPTVFFAPDFNGLVFPRGSATVAVLHDLIALKRGVRPEPGVRGPSRWASAVRWGVYHRKLARADVVVAVSEGVRRDAVEVLGLPPSRVRVVRHGVDLGRFTPSQGRGAFADHPPYLVHVGGRDANKNQERLLHAFAAAVRAAGDADTQLYLAGPWRKRDLRWLTATVRPLGVEGRVRYLGYAADADLSSLYGNARAFLFPSLEEGFGLPLLEAMASGAPVLTSDRSTLREVVGDAALIVEPTSLDALAEGVRRLLTRPTLRDALRRRGFVRAAEFDWARTAAETAQILVECHEAHVRAPRSSGRRRSSP